MTLLTHCQCGVTVTLTSCVCCSCYYYYQAEHGLLQATEGGHRELRAVLQLLLREGAWLFALSYCSAVVLLLVLACVGVIGNLCRRYCVVYC
jgi:hypothetical protein